MMSLSALDENCCQLMNMQEPVFVIGSPRSGTTLLRLILTTHTEMVVPPECGFIVWLHERYRGWSLRSTLDARSRGQFLDDLFACKKISTWEIDRRALEATLIDQQPADYASLCASVFLAFALQQSKNPLLWGDKNNFHTNCLPILNDIYPQARFLHIVRDGRDVACSYREVMQLGSTSPYAPTLSTDIDEIALEWSTNVLQVDDYLSGVVESRRLLVRYEDLVQNTKNIVTELCCWLGLRFEEEMLLVHEANRALKLEPMLTLDWKQRTLEAISTDTVGRYQTLLSSREKIRFATLAGEALTRFGYMSRQSFEKGSP